MNMTRIVLANPLQMVSEIEPDFSSFIESVLSRQPQSNSAGEPQSFVPAADVLEEKEQFVVRCELPGCVKEQVRVTFHENQLVIHGERKPESAAAEANYHWRERRFGPFERTVEFPSTVDPTRVQAEFRDGVLVVTLPKSDEAKPRQIPVRFE